jgi:hypothetical protein
MNLSRTVSSLALGAAVGVVALAGCSSTTATGAPGSSSAATSSTAPSAPTAGVRIAYEENAQVEIFAPSGKRVLIDVWDPTSLTAPATASDILLTTHGHTDHYSVDFESSFPGQKITFEMKSIDTADFKITTIASTHDETLPILEKEGSDYLFVVVVGGLRIAHFGDIGQDKLSDAQLSTLGKVDILITQLANTFSTMDERNKKGFNLVNQVKPPVLIPTHFTSEAATLAGQTWKGAFSTAPITVTREKLPAETTIIFMGNQADSYGTILNLKSIGW